MCLFWVSNQTQGVVSAAECGGMHGGGKVGGENYTDRFERLQKIQGREVAQVTVFWRSTDFIVRSFVFSYSVRVQTQNQRPQNKKKYALFNSWFLKSRTKINLEFEMVWEWQLRGEPPLLSLKGGTKYFVHYFGVFFGGFMVQFYNLMSSANMFSTSVQLSQFQTKLRKT